MALFAYHRWDVYDFYDSALQHMGAKHYRFLGAARRLGFYGRVEAGRSCEEGGGRVRRAYVSRLANTFGSTSKLRMSGELCGAQKHRQSMLRAHDGVCGIWFSRHDPGVLSALAQRKIR